MATRSTGTVVNTPINEEALRRRALYEKEKESERLRYPHISHASIAFHISDSSSPNTEKK